MRVINHSPQIYDSEESKNEKNEESISVFVFYVLT